jgi:hypothetical protein
MWSRLDDALIDHRKIFYAAEVLGKNGGVMAVGMYAIGLMWCNKHLTDGFLPAAVVRSFPHAHNPLALASALVAAGLWAREKRDGVAGFAVHDFASMNPSGDAVRARRKRDAARKQQERQSAGRPASARRPHGNGRAAS